MSEQFLRPGHTYTLPRWLAQAECRRAGIYSDICGRVAARTELQGELTPIEADAAAVFELLTGPYRGADPVVAALAARDIAAIVESNAYQIVHFMGLLPSEVADEVLLAPKKAAYAKRVALIEWQRTGKMPALVERWAERDPTILIEYTGAGAPLAPLPSQPVGTEVSAGGLRPITILAGAVLLLALLAWR